MNPPAHPVTVLWLRRVIIGVQPLISASYLGMAFWGEGVARPQGAWLFTLILPTLLVLSGMWKGQYSAFVWAALADLFYLMAASTDAWSSNADRGFNIAILALAIIGFCAAWAQGIIFRRNRRRPTVRH
ncbi:MAG: hypothetical protein B7Z82_05115 [Halothiobacillus sp. 20-54-6]|nr:MAG: hypothetical protein B7Z82_05115 [Halothiobacillus sp. 20-54-6]